MTNQETPVFDKSQLSERSLQLIVLWLQRFIIKHGQEPIPQKSLELIPTGELEVVIENLERFLHGLRKESERRPDAMLVLDENAG